jgi:hypothetical protein
MSIKNLMGENFIRFFLFKIRSLGLYLLKEKYKLLQKNESI